MEHIKIGDRVRSHGGDMDHHGTVTGDAGRGAYGFMAVVQWDDYTGEVNEYLADLEKVD